MYPYFSSQTGARATGFADLPFDVPEDKKPHYDLFEAKYVAEYLENYVDRRTYAGKALRDRVRLNTRVHSVHKDSDKWIISTRFGSSTKVKQLSATQLILATGHFSEPLIPAFARSDSFTGKVIHQKHLGTSNIFSDEKVSRITVVGGSKSAADMVYASAKAGKNVSWIIRASGSGPLLFLPPEGKFPGSRNSPEDGAVPLAGGLSPSIYWKESWWYWLLHATIIGEWILRFFFNSAQKKANEMYRLHDRPGALPGYEGLKSNVDLRWAGGNLALLQYPDFFDTVAQKVHVHRSDVKDLTGNVVRLENGEEIETDVLLLGTGWTNELSIFSSEEKKRLGLPLRIEDVDEEEALRWAKLESDADKHVLERFPNLRLAPTFAIKPATTTVYRLYRGLASVNDTSIIFPGQWVFANTFLSSQVQALWGVALLLGYLSLPEREEMEKRIALHNVWARRRYPVQGQQGAFLLFEMMGYFKTLLGEDLGLRSHKREGWREELMPMRPVDLKDVVEELRMKGR